MKVQIIKLNEQAKIPTRGTEYSAGYDIYSAEEVTIPAGQWKLVKTGICLFWDDVTYYPQISPRSGLSLKFGISPRAGVIDLDYRREVGVILMNESSNDYHVSIHDRIGQFIFQKIEAEIEFEETSEFPELISSRSGGFGSTG